MMQKNRNHFIQRECAKARCPDCQKMDTGSLKLLLIIFITPACSVHVKVIFQIKAILFIATCAINFVKCCFSYP